MAKKEEISLHRRLGLRFIQILILVMAFALIRNCILISMNSTNPEIQIQQQYYEKGFEAGVQKALNGMSQIEPVFPNLSLERKFGDGYRDGWDETRK